MEEEITEENLKERASELASFHNSRISEKREVFINQISEDVKNYLGSSTYKELREYPNFKNEFEIYAKESDYYVYGIIDKLIIDGDKLLIVDYKTDNVKADKIFEKAEHYLPQLRFYAYTLKRLYKSVNQIDVQLIYIKHPDKIVKYSFNNEEIRLFGNEIKSIVQMIREQNFTKNLDHCAKCHFAINQKCVFQT